MAKRKASNKPRYSAEDHARFIQDLKANDEARRVMADWLKTRGWIVEPLAPMSIAARPEDWNKHSDSGDVWARKGSENGPRTRFEVKQRTIKFSGANDFPFPDVVICRCSGFDRAVTKPAFIVLFNQDRDCAAVIDASKWQTWRKESKTDTRHKDLTQEFYVTDISAVSFQVIPYEFTRAAERDAERARAVAEAAANRCLLYHPDPKNWNREPAKIAGKKERISCKGCGRFIGYTE